MTLVDNLNKQIELYKILINNLPPHLLEDNNTLKLIIELEKSLSNIDKVMNLKL